MSTTCSSVGINHLPTILHTKDQLKNDFNVTNLGLIKYFLGLEIAQTPNGIHIGQRKYALDILELESLQDAKPTPTTIHAYSHVTLCHRTPIVAKPTTAIPSIDTNLNK